MFCIKNVKLLEKPQVLIRPVKKKNQDFKPTNNWSKCLLCSKEYIYDQFKCQLTCLSCKINIQVRENETINITQLMSDPKKMEPTNGPTHDETPTDTTGPEKQLDNAIEASLVLDDSFMKNAKTQRRFYRFRDTIELAQGLTPVTISKNEEENTIKVQQLLRNVMKTLVVTFKQKKPDIAGPAIILKCLKKLKVCRILYKWSNRIWRELTVTDEKEFKDKYELSPVQTKQVLKMFLEVLQLYNVAYAGAKDVPYTNIPHASWLHWILQIIGQHSLAKVAMPFISVTKKEKDKNNKVFEDFKLFCKKKEWPTQQLTKIEVG